MHAITGKSDYPKISKLAIKCRRSAISITKNWGQTGDVNVMGILFKTAKHCILFLVC